MPTLYHCIGARSFRPLWAMGEMGMQCDLRMLPFPPRVHDRTYLAENPLGTVPLLVDGRVRMTESVAICQYLTAKYGPTLLEVRPDEADFGAYLNWCHHGEATLTFPQTIYLRYSSLEPVERRNAQVAEDYAIWFAARLRMAEAHLGNHDFLCASRFTIADISVGFALLLAESIGLGERLPPAVAAYWKRLKSRSGFQAARDGEDAAVGRQGAQASN